MAEFALRVLIAALVIGTASWLSGRHPKAAGFLVALPLASLLVLPMAYLEHREARIALALARSIAIGVPATLIFFAPFVLADRLRLGFWAAYGLGCLLLPVALLVHDRIARIFGVG